MKFADYDGQTGEIIAFYDDGINAEIPPSAIEITEEDWVRHIRGDVTWRVDVSSPKPVLFEYIPAPMSHIEQRRAALSRVDEEHANHLATLTGSATIAERDTWTVKADAARAFEAGTATPGEAAMLTAEARGAGITEADLVAAIIAKADAFLTVIGVAAGLRAQGRAAVMAATDEAVPLDQVEAQVEAVFMQLAHEVQAAITQLQTPTAL